MKIPTIHPNGTSQEDLHTQLAIARIATGLAVEALQDMAPHPRDYPQGDRAYKQATEQHQERVEATRQVYVELQTMHLMLTIPRFRPSDDALWLEAQSVSVTPAETFSGQQSRRLARLIYQRFGSDVEVAAAAWRRLLGNGCDDHTFARLVGL